MSDSLFTVHRFDINLPKFNEDYYLAIFSDVHRFAHNCDVKGWKDYLQYCKSLEERNPGRVYYLGVGDYDDMASTSEREAFKYAKLHDTTVRTLDDIAQKRVVEFCEELSFMKGKLLGLIEGNHYYQFASGQTSTMKMCDALDCKYLGGVSIIRLAFHHEVSNRNVSLDIYAHHTAGSKGGGGRRAGSSVNKLEDMTHTWDADIYVAGHDHQFNTSYPTYLYLDQHMKVKEKDRLLIRTGSFQKGWLPGEEGYVPTFNGKGNFLGAPIVMLRPTRDRSNDMERVYIKKSVLTGHFF